jgi:hypothetical protein
MRRPLLVVLTILLLFGGIAVHRPQADPKTTALRHTDSIRVVRFQLLGLREARVGAAEKALLQIHGVKHLEFESNRKHVVVRFDIHQTNLKKIRDSLKRADFTPVL